MEMSLDWTEVLSEKVVQVCKKDPRLTECECEPLIRSWLTEIKEESRPTLTGVMMASKRKLWGLSPLH